VSFSLNWVLPRLAIGSAPQTASDARRLVSLGVTDVLDLTMHPNDQGEDTGVAGAIYEGTGIRYHSVPMRDNGVQKTVAQYVDAVTFVKDALERRGSKVLVNCLAGQYRSAGTLYAVLRAMGDSPDEAWARITAVRTVYRQYLPGAEAAVPYLPRVVLGDAEPMSAGSTNWLPWAAAAVGVGVFLALRQGANPLGVAFVLPFIPP